MAKKPTPNPANIALVWVVTAKEDKKAALEARIEQLLNLLETEPDVRVSYVSRNPNGSLAVGLLVGEEQVKLGGTQTAMLLPGVKRA